MKNLLLSLALVLVSGIVVAAVSSPEVSAHESRVGNNAVGIIFGEPTGFSGKFWQDSTHAIDIGLAFSFNSFFLTYADYLFHFPGAFGRSSEFVSQLNPYLGPGAVLFVSTASSTFSTRDNRTYFDRSNSIGLGVRFAAGIEWLAPKTPIGVFVEIAPGIGIIPGTFGFVQGGLGVRYYF